MKIRIGIDWCTPIKEKRPTTSEDLENNIVIYKFNNKMLLLHFLSKLTGNNIDTLNEDVTDKYINKCIKQLHNIVDGNPNIIFIQYNDDIYYKNYALPLDYTKVTANDIIDEIKQNMLAYDMRHLIKNYLKEKNNNEI